jgi:hypothetical protein
VHSTLCHNFGVELELSVKYHKLGPLDPSFVETGDETKSDNENSTQGKFKRKVTSGPSFVETGEQMRSDNENSTQGEIQKKSDQTSFVT